LGPRGVKVAPKGQETFQRQGGQPRLATGRDKTKKEEEVRAQGGNETKRKAPRLLSSIQNPSVYVKKLNENKPGREGEDESYIKAKIPQGTKPRESNENLPWVRMERCPKNGGKNEEKTCRGVKGAKSRVEPNGGKAIGVVGTRKGTELLEMTRWIGAGKEKDR